MNKIRIIAAAAILTASVSTAFAGYESFDADIYRGTPAPVQTVAVQSLAAHSNALNSFGRATPNRIERRPTVSAPASQVSPAEEGWMDRASQLY
jgi:hypothetical protein